MPVPAREVKGWAAITILLINRVAASVEQEGRGLQAPFAARGVKRCGATAILLINRSASSVEQEGRDLQVPGVARVEKRCAATRRDLPVYTINRHPASRYNVTIRTSPRLADASNPASLTSRPASRSARTLRPRLFADTSRHASSVRETTPSLSSRARPPTDTSNPSTEGCGTLPQPPPPPSALPNTPSRAFVLWCGVSLFALFAACHRGKVEGPGRKTGEGAGKDRREKSGGDTVECVDVCVCMSGSLRGHDATVSRLS